MPPFFLIQIFFPSPYFFYSVVTAWSYLVARPSSEILRLTMYTSTPFGQPLQMGALKVTVEEF